jgi:hypothetical protein
VTENHPPDSASPTTANQPNWAEILGGVGALAAVALGLWAILRSLTARTESHIMVARSPDLTAAQDILAYERLGLRPDVVQTSFWVAHTRTYTEATMEGYVFALFVNYGPSAIKEVSFSPIDWVAGRVPEPPPGLLPYGHLSPLEPDHFYALLIDVFPPPPSATRWSPAIFDTSQASYQWLSFRMLYRDQLGFSHSLQFSSGVLPPELALLPTSPPLLIVVDS